MKKLPYGFRKGQIELLKQIEIRVIAYFVNVLDAMGKCMSRSVVLIGVMVANIVLTLIFIQNYEAIGSAIATAICLLSFGFNPAERTAVLKAVSAVSVFGRLK